MKIIVSCSPKSLMLFIKQICQHLKRDNLLLLYHCTLLSLGLELLVRQNQLFGDVPLGTWNFLGSVFDCYCNM